MPKSTPKAVKARQSSRRRSKPIEWWNADALNEYKAASNESTPKIEKCEGIFDFIQDVEYDEECVKRKYENSEQVHACEMENDCQQEKAQQASDQQEAEIEEEEELEMVKDSCCASPEL